MTIAAAAVDRPGVKLVGCGKTEDWVGLKGAHKLSRTMETRNRLRGKGKREVGKANAEGKESRGGGGYL
jgi:hypothetical protein